MDTGEMVNASIKRKEKQYKKGGGQIVSRTMESGKRRIIRARNSKNSSDEVQRSKPPKLLSGDQGPAFQTHALQIILFEPLTYEPNTILGLLQIESLQIHIRMIMDNSFIITWLLSLDF